MLILLRSSFDDVHHELQRLTLKSVLRNNEGQNQREMMAQRQAARQAQ